MPGIAGTIGPDAQNSNTLHSMVGSMLHESFYTSQTYTNERLGLQAGWAGLKGAFADCLPIWNEKKDVCLIFAGEDFTDRAVLDSLKAKGHQFQDGDASCLVHLYEEDEAGFFERLNGWFSGLLLDLRQEKIVLFNDRYGLGRIYIQESPNGFYFASEAKALLKVLPESRQMDLQSLGEFFSCSCVLENRTLFKGISLLPPASAWTFSRCGKVTKRSYFKPAMWEQQSPLSPAEFAERLEEVFARVLPRYFRNAENIGMSLTGGVDSRMIMAQAARPARTLPCYTFGGIYRDCADVKIARRVANICQQSHQVIPVDRGFLPEFPALAEKTVYVSDGTMDVTGAVELYVNRTARKIAPIRLTGNYGGEVLRGLVAFKPGTTDAAMLQPEFARQVTGASATYEREIAGKRLSFIAFKQVPWHHFGRLSVEQSQLTLRSPYLDNELVSLAYRVPLELAESKELPLRLIAKSNPALRALGTDRASGLGAIPGISKVQRLWQEFTFKAEYAYDYGMPQWLARMDHAFAPLHPEKILLGRHKFYHYRVWYRDEWADYLQDMLLDSRTKGRGYLSGARLEEMVRGHIRGDQNHTSDINKVLTTELIYRKLLEQN